MRELVVEWLLHAAVAAGVVELLLAGWRPRRGDERLALRSVAFVVPVVLPPVLRVVAPVRQGVDFADTWALFAARHWSGVELGGVALETFAVVAAATTGLWLYARDLAPLVREARRDATERPAGEPGEEVADDVAELAARLGVGHPPRLLWLDEDEPVVFATGALRPALVLSRGTLEALDREPLRAVLAHELAHLARRDLLLSWVVMSARTALFFNPFTQLVARACALEVERRADDLAAFAVGDPEALADGIDRLLAARRRVGADQTSSRWRRGLGGAVGSRARALALKARARRLRSGWPPEALPCFRVRVVLTGAALAGLLVFVVA